MVLKMKNSVEGLARKGGKIPWIVEQMENIQKIREKKIRQFKNLFRRLIQHQKTLKSILDGKKLPKNKINKITLEKWPESKKLKF